MLRVVLQQPQMGWHAMALAHVQAELPSVTNGSQPSAPEPLSKPPYLPVHWLSHGMCMQCGTQTSQWLPATHCSKARPLVAMPLILLPSLSNMNLGLLR